MGEFGLKGTSFRPSDGDKNTSWQDTQGVWQLEGYIFFEYMREKCIFAIMNHFFENLGHSDFFQVALYVIHDSTVILTKKAL